METTKVDFLRSDCIFYLHSLLTLTLLLYPSFPVHFSVTPARWPEIKSQSEKMGSCD